MLNLLTFSVICDLDTIVKVFEFIKSIKNIAQKHKISENIVIFDVQ